MLPTLLSFVAGLAIEGGHHRSSGPVLRVLYSFPDTLGAPGIGTIAYHQVCGLIARGHEVHVHCTFLARPLHGKRHCSTTLGLGGLRIPHRLLGRNTAYRYHDSRVAAAIRKSPRSFDIVHLWPRATLASARAARQHGIPTVRELPNTHTAHALEVVAMETARLGLAPIQGNSRYPDPAILALEEEEFRSVDMPGSSYGDT